MTKGSTLLVAALENEGVDRIYGIPGEENLDVVEAIRGSSIELVLTRHEQAAAFMAATYGRLTGKPGVCISTLGPGALNLTTGAAYALLGAMPMIMITGQKGILVLEASALSDRGCRRDDEAADQAVASNRLGQHDPHPRARSVSRRGGGATRPGAPRASGGYCGRAVRGGCVGRASPARAARGRNAGARSCRAADLPGPAAARHAGRGRFAAALDLRHCAVRAANPDSLFHHADGQGHRARRYRTVHGHCRALRARLRARGHRSRRSDHHHRP